MTDLDKSGQGFQRVRTYLGPSLGWKDELVKQSTHITTGGVYKVLPGDSLLLVDVAASVAIQLPDVRDWIQQPGDQPATGFERSITIKDQGGNAANFNIVITPFGQQQIDNINQAVLIATARGTVRLLPLIEMTGWVVETVGQGGGGGTGGGDVFKAGNNTFTGVNTFVNQTIVPNLAPSDNSQNAANTKFVKDQNYITGAALLPYALLDSPAFTGFPTAPTPAPSAADNTIVTVGFVENALIGIAAGPPLNAEYILSSNTNAPPLGRVLTNTATVTWDFSTPGQVKAFTAAGGGNVSSVGTPVGGNLAVWVTPTTIEGVDGSSLYAPIDSPVFTGDPTAPTPPNGDNDTSIATTAFVKAVAQPLDGDLTAISGLLGTNTIYYRSADSIWSPVTFSGLTFSGGVLTSTGGGNVNSVPTPFAGQIAQWTDATHIQGVNLQAIKGYTFAATAPGSPNPGDFWYDSTTGVLSIWLDDGTSAQWVMISPPLKGDAGAAGPQGPAGTNAVGLPAQGFRAHKNGVNQTGIVNTGGKLTFGFEDYDVGGYYDTATSRWTPPAGIIHIDAALYSSAGNTVGGSLYLQVFKNGTILKQGNDVPSNAFNAVRVSVDDVANGTDYYELFLSAGGIGGPLTAVGATEQTWWCGHIVSQQGPAGPTGPIGPGGLAAQGFRANKNGVDQTGITQNVFTKVTFGFEDYDVGNFFDTANSRWIPPAGMIHLDLFIGLTASLSIGAYGIVGIAKNGTVIKTGRSGALTSGELAYGSVSVDDVASGTDYYEAFVNGTTAPGTVGVQGGATITFFSGHVVSQVGPPGPIGATGPSGSVTGLLVPPQGRLTLASATPVMTASQSAKSVIYYTPYVGDRVPIYDGTNFSMMQFTELSQLSTDSTKSPAATVLNAAYDMFVWNDAGTLRCTRGPAWTNDTTRAMALTKVGGTWLNATAITLGPAAQRGTYVGTVRSSSDALFHFLYGSSAAGGGAAYFGVWNCYNRVPVKTQVIDSTSSWAYAVAAWRSSNNSAGNRVYFVAGLQEDCWKANHTRDCVNGSGAYCVIGVGYDSTTVPLPMGTQVQNASQAVHLSIDYVNTSLGWHFVQAIENNGGSYYGNISNVIGGQLNFEWSC